MDLSGLLLAIIVIGLFIHDALKMKKRRAQIKERANSENNAEHLSQEYYRERLSESELMYEDLEETYFIHIALLIGLAVQLYWKLWYFSIAAVAVVAILGIKYLATKPFSHGISDQNA